VSLVVSSIGRSNALEAAGGMRSLRVIMTATIRAAAQPNATAGSGSST
jgi:hypothetical protein